MLYKKRLAGSKKGFMQLQMGQTTINSLEYVLVDERASIL